MRTFKEFLLAQKESTAAKRAKNAGFLGLAVAGPEASFNAGATANPGMLDYYKKFVKGKSKQPQVTEGAVNPGIDKWLDSVDKLKKELDSVPKDDEDLEGDEVGDLEDEEDDEDDDNDGDKEMEDDGYEPDDAEFDGPEDEDDDDEDERADDLDSVRMGLHLDKLKTPKPDKNPIHKDDDEDEFGDWAKLSGI